MVVAAMPGRARSSWAPHLRLAAALATAGLLLLWTLSGRQAAQLQPSLSTQGSSKVRIGWVGRVFDQRPPSGLTVKEAQQIASDNSGNLVWAFAARQLVDPNATELVPLEAPYTARVSAVLMPTANMLTNTSKYHTMQGHTAMLDAIAKAQAPKAPILLIAIGSQVRFEEALPSGGGSGADAGAPDYSGAHAIALHQQQVDFLQRIKSSGGLITTRGLFTRAIFAANGVAPPLPLGCPSFFLNHNPQLGAALQRKWDAVLAARDPKLRVAVTLPNIPGDKPAAYLPAMRLLAERVFKAFPNSVAVLQTPRDIDTLEQMHSRYDLFLREGRVRYFYDVESWVDGLKACCDFVFGFRIHGTMTGVAAEVPGIVIAPDLRVKELAEAMVIPTVDMDKANLDPDTFDLFDFIKSVPSYGARFDARRREVARVYASEFERLKVPLHPGIASIASLPEP